MKLVLDNYPTAVHYFPFLVNIKSCQISTFTSDADISTTYNLHTGKKFIAYNLFTEVPNAASLPNG